MSHDMGAEETPGRGCPASELPGSSISTSRKRPVVFFLGFGLVALLLAGVVSYFADSNPDGLDAATRQGCTITETEQGEQLNGSCIAQNAKDHALRDGPFADYTVGGDARFTGMAGMIGVVASLGVAGGLFWVLRRRGSKSLSVNPPPSPNNGL